jgi:hypothetical protein
VHVDHDRALTGAVYLRRPEIDAQAVFARYTNGRAAMNQELIFVVASLVFAIPGEVSLAGPPTGLLLRTDAAIFQRVANPCPGLRFCRRHKSPVSGGRRAIGDTFEDINVVVLETTDLSRTRLHHCSGVRGNDLAPPAGCRQILWSGVRGSC